MPISPISFPILTFEQANPGLARAKYQAEIANQYGAAIKQGIETAYLPRTLAEKLKESQALREKMQQESQWYPKVTQSEIDYRKMAGGHLGAETAKLNALLPSEKAKAEFLASHPEFNIGLQGDALTVLLANAIKNNPNDPAFRGLSNQGQPSTGGEQFPGVAEAMQTGKGLTIQPQDYQGVAEAVRASGGRAQYNPQAAWQQQQQQANQLGYNPANQANIAQFLSGQQQQANQLGYNPANQANIAQFLSGQQQQANQLGYNPANQANIAQFLSGQQQPQASPEIQNAIAGQQQPQVAPQINQAITNAANTVQPSGSLSDQLMQGVMIKQRELLARSNLYNARASLVSLNSLPVDQKDALLAQIAGAGMDATEAVNMFGKGMSLSDIMATKGYTDPQHYPPSVYPTTTASRTAMQTRTLAAKETEPMVDFMIKAIAPYSQTVFGISPKLMSDSLVSKTGAQTLDSMVHMDNGKFVESINKSGIKNASHEQIQDFLASMIMLPDFAGVRFRQMNGQRLGSDAMKEIIEASAMKVNYARSQFSPEDWVGAQRKAQEQIAKATKLASISNYFQGADAMPINASSVIELAGGNREEFEKGLNKESQQPSNSVTMNGVEYVNINGEWHKK